MASPNTQPTPEHISDPALQELYTQLSSMEMQIHPDVDAIRASGEVIRSYFERATEIDETFKGVVDRTVSIAGALVHRAEGIVPSNKDAVFGSLKADETLAEALWHAARGLDFASGSRFTTNDADRALSDLHRANNAPERNRSPRVHATDILRNSTRKLEDSDDYSVQREFKAIALASATAVIELAEYGGRNDKVDLGVVGTHGETGNVPMFKDYIAKHLATNVEAIASK